MQRKPGYPVANSNIKMPDNLPALEPSLCEDDGELQQRRQQLISFGHSQWGFNNWNWAVTKQELDFVDAANGKYTAGVVAFVSVSVKNIDLHRENIGYATSVANTKGFAIYKSRKVAVTNALRETLLSFGGAVASELTELLETNREPTEPTQENNQNLANTNHANANLNHVAAANLAPTTNPPVVKNLRRDSAEGGPVNMPPHIPPMKNAAPVARAHPMPASLPPPPPVLPRPASNVSFVLQPVMGGMVPPLYAPPRLAAPQIPQVYPNYYEYGPWHFYEPHGNVNLNFNLPPKNLVVNSRAGSVECKNACRVAEGEALQYAPQQNRGCWIKPTIFYDGFWTEQKVKKWVAEQVEKQFPEEHKTPSPGKPDIKLQ